MTAAAAAVAGCVAASGCGFHGVYSLPLPGAAAAGAHTYRVTVQLADALDLVPYSAVKVNNATVGHVADVRLVDRRASVVCQLPDSVHLPANAVARVEQTSLLGEKFVEIEPPANEPARGRLHDGSVIPLARTDTSATVEEVLGALSLLLNGGGLAQVQTIARELNRALAGREPAARDLLVQLRTFATGLDAQKQQILRAIAGLDRLARTVRAQETSLTDAVDRMPAALRILADDRAGLTRMLVAMKRLGDVAVHVETASSRDMVANLKALQPTLTRLAEVGDVIPKTLQLFFTYPSPDGPECCFFGDYGNINVTVDLSRRSLLQNFSGSGGTGRNGSAGSPGGGSLPLPVPSAPVPGLPNVPAPSLPTPGPTPSAPSLPSGPLPLFGAASFTVAWTSGPRISDLLLGALQ